MNHGVPFHTIITSGSGYPFEPTLGSTSNMRGLSILTISQYYNTLETLRERFSGVLLQHITKRTYQSFLNDYGQLEAKKRLEN